MIRLVHKLYVLLFFAGNFYSYAKNPVFKEATHNYRETINYAVGQNSKDSLEIISLLDMGRFYLLKRGEYQNDLDSALISYNRALKLSNQLGYDDLANESLVRIGEVHFQTSDLQEGKKYFLKVIENLKSKNDKESEADVWMRMGYSVYRESREFGYFYSFPVNQDNSSLYKEIQSYFLNAKTLYAEQANIIGELEAQRQIADVYMISGKLNLAENMFLSVLKEYELNNYKKNHMVLDLLAINYRLKGEYDKALEYEMRSIESAKSTGDTTSIWHSYISMGLLDNDFGRLEQSIDWLRKSLNILKHQDNIKPEFYRVVGYYTASLLSANRLDEALTFLSKVKSEIPPYSIIDKEIYAKALGDCYNSMGKYDLAEENYLAMMDFDNKLTIGGITPEACYTISNFYVERGNYDRAAFYAKQALELPKGIAVLSRVKDFHLILFKVDSAKGNYMSAIKNFQYYSLIKDSIFSVEKNKQIEELQVKYETAKKEGEILSLQSQSIVQEDKLKEVVSSKNLIIGVALFFLVLIVMLVYRYSDKQKTNRMLLGQKNEINQKNLILQNMIDEKEWLLKEIHHRVKNNLQMVMSLLNTQANYLDNQEALLAIQNSQHRLYAISLIHQKLYKSESVDLINMEQYIKDLVNYLKDSFDISSNIDFEFDIEKILLDETKSIPLGLILNESITNCIKYAFPNNKKGTVFIFMKTLKNGLYCLSVKDDGIGFPDKFDINKTSSLGFSLIKGLCKQLDGEVQVKNENGVLVEVRFK